MILYKTIMAEGLAEQIIEKSRFIGHARPVVSKEEADAFFGEIRRIHKGATHNVPAFVIGDRFQQQWASDDGEPQGTSGVPMAQMLVKEGITNTALIITRYFGGIKLGAGGLVRAYTSTAKLALENAGVCEAKEMSVLCIKVDYTYHGKLQNMAENGDFQLKNTIFEDKVILEIAIEPEACNHVKSLLSNVTSGNLDLLSQENDIVHIPVSR